MLFQGEEWAASSPFLYFADHEDEEMARLVSEGRKNEFAAFGWDPTSIPDPEKRETFEQSKLKWDEVNEGEHAEMLGWYRELIRLRRSTACLNDGEPGRTHVSCNEEQKWLSMERGHIRVVCNLGEAERTFPLTEECEVVLASGEGVYIENAVLSLPPDSVAIMRLRQTPGGV
jgi:maltooligosyltrehalose trehalohydrolase